MIYNFRLARYLKDALFNEHKYCSIKAGRRTGKTFNAVIWIVVQLLSRPSPTRLPDGTKTQAAMGLWVDTTVNNVKNYVDLYFNAIVGRENYEWSPQRHQITFHRNGAVLHLRSATRRENMEGFEYDYVVLNEAGIILKDPSLWDNSIQPMCKNAQVRFVGTPKGKNKFHELYHKYPSYTFSAYDSPYWTTEQLDALKAETPAEVWAQEYMAEFIDGAGAVFRKIDVCSMPVIHNYQTKPDTYYVMGVDLAKHQDFTVVMVADRITNEVIFMDRFNTIDWTFQKLRIKAIWERFNKCKVIIDATGIGDPIFDDLCKMGMYGCIIPFKFTQSSKTELIQHLSIMLDNEKIRYCAWPVLMNELNSYEYTQKADGRFAYNAPAGSHDDCVIALALVATLLKHGYNAKPGIIL